MRAAYDVANSGSNPAVPAFGNCSGSMGPRQLARPVGVAHRPWSLAPEAAPPKRFSNVATPPIARIQSTVAAPT